MYFGRGVVLKKREGVKAVDSNDIKHQSTKGRPRRQINRRFIRSFRGWSLCIQHSPRHKYDYARQLQPHLSMYRCNTRYDLSPTSDTTNVAQFQHISQLCYKQLG